MPTFRVHDHRLQLKRANHLKKAISSSSHLELLIEVDEHQKDKAAARWEKLGVLTNVYQFIPYISVACESREAASVIDAVSKGYAEIRAFSRGIEASSTFSFPKISKSRSIRENLWNLSNVGAYEARKISTGAGIRVGIIDTGIEYSHPELIYNFENVKGYDFIEKNDNPVDRNGHGTHVAGIAAGQVYGIAIESTLYAIRVLDENGSGSESNVIAGIEWSLENRIDIANMSLGSPVASSAFEDICYVAAQKGLVLVAAAGNDGGEFAIYPAAFGEPVISVAAVDRYNRHADFSNTFIANDVSAPGVSITSSYINGSYATLDGTSMATPHVTGSIALALPLLKNNNIFDLVDRTSQDIGRDREVFGAGLVRADLMVNELVKGHSLVDMIKRIVW